MLVNSLGKKHKDLTECGVIAKAFLAAAGKGLQDDFEKTGGLDPGQVSVCSVVGNMNCQEILHFGLKDWASDTMQVKTTTPYFSHILSA